MDLYNMFIESLFNFVTKTSLTTSQTKTIIRKHTQKLSENGDISFPLKIINWRKFHNIENCPENIVDEEVLEKLCDLSEKWIFHIEKYKICNDNVVIYLDRVFCMKRIIVESLNENYTERLLNKTPKCYAVNYKNENSHDLSHLRLVLLVMFTKNLIQTLGHRIETPGDDVDHILNFTTSSRSTGGISISCGPVVDSKSNKKCTFTCNELYTKRRLDMRLLAEHKYGVRISSQPGWQALFEKLGDAAVTIELLQVRPSSVLRINMDDPGDCNNKGASFLLYNGARIANILKKFNTNERCKLPDLNDVDFSLLNQPEEWELLYVFILSFPNILTSCFEPDSGRINSHLLCSFLFGLCSKFSVYYRRVRILTPPREHLLPTMYARIYLLMSIENILHKAFKLLNIEPITQM